MFCFKKKPEEFVVTLLTKSIRTIFQQYLLTSHLWVIPPGDSPIYLNLSILFLGSVV